jgi:hypothetical protein
MVSFRPFDILITSDVCTDQVISGMIYAAYVFARLSSSYGPSTYRKREDSAFRISYNQDAT